MGEPGEARSSSDSRIRHGRTPLAALQPILSAVALAAAGAAAVPPAQALQLQAGEPDGAAQAGALYGEIAELIEINYVDPATAKRYAAAFRAKVARAQSGAADPAALARRLTDELQSVAPDAHLRVIPPGTPLPALRRTGEQGHQVRGGSGAVEAARWIAPGVAYLRLKSMAGDAGTVAAIERFAVEHLEADTIIIDARANPGGGSGPSEAILPYLYGKPTVLVHMDTRAGPDAAGLAPLAEGPSVRRVASPPDVVRRERWVHPHPTERRLADARVFYLTSAQTASAAETFALALKRTRRGAIVGERTAGAGHFGRIYPLAGGFHIFLPIGRTFDPDTGLGFERTGVAPDVEVPAKEALREALTRAGVTAAGALSRAIAAAEAADD